MDLGSIVHGALDRLTGAERRKGDASTRRHDATDGELEAAHLAEESAVADEGDFGDLDSLA
ncbi:MAG TPA: hypothetical protein VF998_01740 [Candidatus Limnocylindria bacterium]